MQSLLLIHVSTSWMYFGIDLSSIHYLTFSALSARSRGSGLPLPWLPYASLRSGLNLAMGTGYENTVFLSLKEGLTTMCCKNMTTLAHPCRNSAAATASTAAHVDMRQHKIPANQSNDRTTMHYTSTDTDRNAPLNPNQTHKHAHTL